MAKTTLGEIQERIKQYLKVGDGMASAEVAAAEASQALAALRTQQAEQWIEIELLLERAGFTIDDPGLVIALLSEGVVGHTRRQRGSDAQPAVQAEMPDA